MSHDSMNPALAALAARARVSRFLGIDREGARPSPPQGAHLGAPPASKEAVHVR